MRPSKKLLVVLPALTLLLSASGRSATDLNVTYIERMPRYDYDASPNRPSIGDTVTFYGHIKNWGPQDVASVTYRWSFDGSTVEIGSLDGFSANEERVVSWSWVWSDDRHYVGLTVDPHGVIAESSELNNSIADPTDGLAVGFWVEQSVWDYFNQHQVELGVGSTSWADWGQRQMARWNELCDQAVWTVSPAGVRDRVRIDKLITVADGALPLGPWGLPTNHPDVDDKTVDLMWGFPATLLQTGMYDDHQTVRETNPFYVEQSLVHELGHARYLIDPYGWDVHNTNEHDSVQIWEGGVYVAGSVYMPFLAWDSVLYYNHSGGVMGGPFGFAWSPYEAAALNLIAGQRACCGNFNAPWNIGVFLDDLPERNHLRLVGPEGEPLSGASVRIYRAEEGPGWYGKTIDNIFDLERTADADGWVSLPTNPFSNGQIEHTYGIANGVAVLRIAHGQSVWYRFLEVGDFNLEYWAGQTGDAQYTICPQCGTACGDGICEIGEAWSCETDCPVSKVFADGFESGDTSAWSGTK